MIGEPLHDGGVLVSGVVIENGVNDLACRHGAFDGRKGADEFLMPVLLHAAADGGSSAANSVVVPLRL